MVHIRRSSVLTIIVAVGGPLLALILQGCAFLGGGIVLEQGGTTWTVTPLSNGEAIEEFWGHEERTTTGLQRSDVSIIFLWEGPKGTSLVIIHDKDDGTSGAVSFRFTGLPTDQGRWIIQDDLDASVGPDFDSETDTRVDWKWYGPFIDGGAFRGGLNQAFDITIVPAFNEEAERYSGNLGKIDEWHFLTGSAENPKQIQLNMDSPVTILKNRMSFSLDNFLQFNTSTTSSRSWQWPRPDPEVIQEYANPKEDGSYHTGLDIDGSGDTVRAASQGTVVARCPNGQVCPGYSTNAHNHNMQGIVILRHHLTDGSQVYSLYAHLGEIEESFVAGDTVARGEPLGSTGVNLRSGRWVSHVHFEVKDAPELHNPTGGKACQYETTMGKCWGYTPEDPGNFGYQNPEKFLE